MVEIKTLDVTNYLNEKLKEKNLQILDIIPFGSRVKGIITEGSDIDIIIISDDFKDKDILERASMTKDAEIMTIKKFQTPLDIVTLTKEEFNNSLISTYT